MQHAIIEALEAVSSEVGGQFIFNCDIEEILLSGIGDFTPAVHADPPWDYRNKGVRGAAANKYGGLPIPTILRHLNLAAKVAEPDALLWLWQTFPTAPAFWEHQRRIALEWECITGGAWGKLGSNPYNPSGRGVGTWFAGDAEPVTLWKLGKPKNHLGKCVSTLWNTERTRHSRKPSIAMEAFLEIATSPGDIVLDLYAGEFASLAILCRQMGRSYIGAEIDPKRCARAQEALASVLPLKPLEHKELPFPDPSQWVLDLPSPDDTSYLPETTHPV